MFAGGIAHDISAILDLIAGRAASIKQSNAVTEPLPGSVDVVAAAAEHATALVRQLLDFADKSDAVMKRISLGEAVKEIGTLLEEAYPRTAVLSQELQNALSSS